MTQEQAEQILLQPKRKIAVDIETVSLENTLPLGLGVATSPEQGFYFFNLRDPLLEGVFQSTEVVAGQNIKFDLGILRGLGYTIQNYEDTMLIAYCSGLLENSLVSLSRDVLSKPCPSVTEQWKKKGQGNVGIDHVRMADICVTHACLTYELEEKLPKTDLYRDIDKPCVELLLEMEDWGVLVDQFMLTRLEQSVMSKALPLERQLLEQLGIENLNSNTQVLAGLKALGIKPYKKFKSAKDSVAKEALKPLKLELTDNILKYRSYMKTVQTYISAFRKVDHKGRLHTVFGLTNTGRWRSGDREQGKPNLQNLTRNERFQEEE